MYNIFYWIGVATVTFTSLIVFLHVFQCFIGWLLLKSGMNKYSNIGESFIAFLWSSLYKK